MNQSHTEVSVNLTNVIETLQRIQSLGNSPLTADIRESDAELKALIADLETINEAAKKERNSDIYVDKGVDGDALYGRRKYDHRKR